MWGEKVAIVHPEGGRVVGKDVDLDEDVRRNEGSYGGNWAHREEEEGGKGVQWTYAQYAQRVLNFAWALKDAGIMPGDRVAVIAPNWYVFRLLVFLWLSIDGCFVLI